MWNTSSLLDDGSGFGDVLHRVLGYSSSPSLLQLLAWAAFLAVGLAAFLESTGSAFVRVKATLDKPSGLSRAQFPVTRFSGKLTSRACWRRGLSTRARGV